MTTRGWAVLILLGTALCATGCLRMVRGTTQPIDVTTTPPGARVTIRPGHIDMASPARVMLHRKGEGTVNAPGAPDAVYLVTASLPGYRDATVAITRRTSGEVFTRNIVWLHPLFWGIGLAVDFSSGAAYELAPTDILLVLEPEPSPPAPPGAISPPRPR
jgi:hypothetical protein